ncbi:MAG: lamin tail domain-containing protein, partial [Myxococcota bacterium]
TDTGEPPVEADCAGSADVVVNELVYSTGAEFVEIYNAGTSDVTLDGWVLSFGTRPSSTSEVTIPAGTIAPGGFLVIGGPDATFKDVEADLEDIGNGSNTDGLLLLCNGATVDTVVYSSPNDDGWTDDSGAVATSLAEKPGSSESIARVADGVDTDQCGVDFVADVPSPGYSNTAAPVGDANCDNGDGIKINELAYTTDAEWIEIYNAGAGPVELDAWVIQFGTSSYNKEAEIPDDTTLAPGEWLVLGSAGAATKDIEIDLDFGNASDTDAVRITCNGVGVDTLLYGSPNDNGWADDTGATATSFASKHGDGESLARSSDGYDTDQCGLDFVVSTEPSPGAANPYVPPPVCEPGASIRINEFIYNPEGTDSGSEWVELVNTGSAPARLDAWTIEVAGTDWADKFTFPTGAEIAPGGFLVVGGDNVSEADLVATSLSIDNASSGAGGLRLVDCEGAVVDTVLYGGDIEDPITGDAGSTEVVPETGEGASLGRYPDGVDTNAAADWFPYGEPTPGVANTDPGATDGDDDKDGPGCGNRNPPKPGEGGCTTVLPFGGMEVGLAALALLRRRRRA